VGDLVAALNIAGGTFADFQKAADKAMGQAATKAKAMADSMGTMLSVSDEVKLTLEAQVTAFKAADELLKDEIKKLTEKRAHQEGLSALDRTSLKNLKARRQELSLVHDQQKKIGQQTKHGAEAAESFLDSLGLHRKEQAGILGILTKSKATQEGFGKELGKSIKSGKMFANAMQSAGEGIMQASIAMMKIGAHGGELWGVKMPGLVEAIKDSLTLPAELYRSYGNMEEYNDMIIESRSELAKWGVTEKEAGKAIAELASTIPDFNIASKSAQKEMRNVTTALEKMGIDTKTTIGTQEKLIKTLGMAPKEAAKYTKSLVGLSKQMKVGNKFFQDMQGSMEQLAAFTKDKAIKVFEKMTTTAHTMGLSIGQLWKTVEGFQTFDSASQKVAEFNIALGGPYLNTIKMMKAAHDEPIKVIEQMQDAFKASGKSLNDMSPAMVKYMASTINVSKEELKRIMGSKAALKKWGEEQEKSKERQKDLNAMVTKAQDIFMELSAAIRDAFFENGDFIKSMKDMISSTGKWIKENKWLIDTFIYFVKPPGALLALMAGGILAITGKLFLMNIQIKAMTGGMHGVGTGLSSVFGGSGLSNTMGGMGKMMKGLGGIAMLAGTAFSVLSDLSNADTRKKKRVAQGGMGGALAGAAAGAAIGSFVPVVGTLMGAGIGAMVGHMAGKSIAEDVPPISGATAIITPKGPIGLSPGDIVSAGRTGGSMDKGFKSLAGTQNRTNELLQALLNKDSNVYMDGDKITRKVNGKNTRNAMYGDHSTALS